MTKQRKVVEADEYETPTQRLLSFLRLPHKNYQEIYLAITARYLRGNPYQVGWSDPYAQIGNKCHLEPDLAKEKVITLETMGWIKLQKVHGSIHSAFVPIWRIKKGIKKEEFALALKAYHTEILKDNEEILTTAEILEIMNSICIVTKEKVNSEICALHRWGDCQNCKWGIHK